jgi:hypothetical protein
LLSGCGGGNNSSTAAATTVQAPDVAAAAVATGTAAPAPGLPSKYVNDEEHRLAMSSVSATGDVATAPSTVSSGRVRALAVTTVPETVIYVSISGNDAWSGSLAQANATNTDGPVRTLPAAQNLARTKLAAMVAGAARNKVRVSIGAGTYYLASTWTFTPADSGVLGYPVVYEASIPGTVTLSGGLPLGSVVAPSSTTPVKFTEPFAYTTTAANAGGQLFVNERRAILARQPNVGKNWFVQRPVITDAETGAERGKESFAPPADALAWINALPSADRSRAVVEVYQAWTTSQHRLSTLPAPANALRLAPRAVWPYQYFGVDQRFYIENVSAALDAAGEWIWDTAGVLYIPRVDEAGTSLSAVMPVLDKLITISGDLVAKTWVQNLEFRGLNFAYTRYGVPQTGFNDAQAANQIGAAIEVDGARKVVFDNVQVSHTGGYAIWLRQSVRDSQVTNSLISDTGAGGVRIGQTAQSAADVNATGSNTLADNRVSNTGSVFPGAVGVWIGQSFDNKVVRNAISNTSYSAISVGWKWGYGGATSGRNQIKNNLLYNIGNGMLNDAGAIYLLGESPGTTISGNYIREVRGYPAYGPGTWGIYADEGASGLVVENNMVVGAQNGGFHLNYGRSNIVRYNLFAGGDVAELRVSVSDPLNTLLAFDSNLVVPNNIEPFELYATAPDVIYTNNLVSTLTKAAAVNAAKCSTGCKQTAMTVTGSTDPRYINVVGLGATSISNIQATVTTAGPAGVVSSALPPVQTTPLVADLAPPLAYQVDVVGTPIGNQPLGLTYYPANKINLVAKTGAPGGRCLEFADDAVAVNSWEPYAYGKLNHTSGTTTVEFKLYTDAGTNFIHEWRDNASPYRIGPSFRITASGVQVAGTTLAFTPNQWLNVKVTAGVGAKAGMWNIEVTDALGTIKRISNIPVVTAGWKNFMWMGMISDAKVASKSCLSNVTASNLP